MGLMGNLYMGSSGLRVASNSLNTVAHNVTNADTDGYTRQQISLVTSNYITTSKTDAAVGYTQYGLGVTYSETRQIRDTFLDTNYRRENGRNEFYDTSVDALNQVEDILGESSGAESFSVSIENFWTAIEELTKDPCNEVNQNLLVTRGYEFISQASDIYQSLCDYQMNLNTTIENNVNDINDLAHQLEDLNIAIMKVEAGGVEHANDLRDQRNEILDELSGYGSISWKENTEGYVSVQLEGTDLIKGGVVNELGLYKNEQTGFDTVYWTQNAKYKFDDDGNRVVDVDSLDEAKVFDMSREISSDINTDIGSLKAALYARGDHYATYKDMADVDEYTSTTSQSIIMNVEAEFDQMIHELTTAMNEALIDAHDRAKETYPDSTYLENEDGSVIQFFTLIAGTDKFEAQKAGETDEEYQERLNDYLGNMEPQGETESDEDYADRVKEFLEKDDTFTISNIQINQNLRQTPTLLGFRLDDGSEDIETMEKLSDIFSDENYTLNPNVTTPLNFHEYYNALVGQVSTSGSVYSIISDSQTKTLNSLDSAREQILGVNTDEELTFMIQYQNAYNAASRYINVIDEMLEHLVNTLGA